MNRDPFLLFKKKNHDSLKLELHLSDLNSIFITHFPELIYRIARIILGLETINTLTT